MGFLCYRFAPPNREMRPNVRFLAQRLVTSLTLATCWRWEVDSNFEYRFRRCANVPSVRELQGFHSRNKGKEKQLRLGQGWRYSPAWP